MAQIQVKVQDVGTFPVDTQGRSTQEIQRQLAASLGAPWITSAEVCALPNGNLEFKRPPAAPKGR